MAPPQTFDCASSPMVGEPFLLQLILILLEVALCWRLGVPFQNNLQTAVRAVEAVLDGIPVPSFVVYFRLHLCRIWNIIDTGTPWEGVLNES